MREVIDDVDDVVAAGQSLLQGRIIFQFALFCI